VASPPCLLIPWLFSQEWLGPKLLAATIALDTPWDANMPHGLTYTATALADTLAVLVR